MSRTALVVVVVVVIATLGASAARAEVPEEPCAGGQDATTALPALKKAGLVGRALAGARLLDTERSLDVDEVHIAGRVALGTQQLELPLALPGSLSGSATLRFIETCGAVDVVSFDDEVVRAIVGLPVTVHVVVRQAAQKKQKARVLFEGDVVSESAVLLLEALELHRDGTDKPPLRLYIGSRPPHLDTQYFPALRSLGPEIEAAVRDDPSPDVARLRFLEVAGRLKAQLPQLSPAERSALLAPFSAKDLPADVHPLLAFWQSALAARSAVDRDKSARLIVSDDVQAVWVDGALVFDRQKGSSSSVEAKVASSGPKGGNTTTAVRVAIVSIDKGSGATVVHDAFAPLRAGEIYTVRDTFVASMNAGARRECVRMEGELPAARPIRWREISGSHAPLMPSTQTYRPSGATAERAFAVVPTAGEPFPPVPLVYSYTHPGTYKWTLSKDGGVRLDLIDDPKLCQPGSTAGP